MSDDLLTSLGINLQAIFAGFAGGVVNVFVFRQAKPLEIAGSMIVGALTANFLAEPMAHLIGLNQGPSGFIVGLTGMAICQGLVTAVKNGKLPILGSGTDGGKQP